MCEADVIARYGGRLGGYRNLTQVGSGLNLNVTCHKLLLQGMEEGWVVIETAHTVGSGLNVTCHA